MSKLDAIADETSFYPSTPLDTARESVKELFAGALGCALDRAGWQIDHGPGYLWMRRGDAKINPRQWIDEMVSPEFSAAAWHDLLDRFQLDPAMSLEYVDDRDSRSLNELPVPGCNA